MVPCKNRKSSRFMPRRWVPSSSCLQIRAFTERFSTQSANVALQIHISRCVKAFLGESERWKQSSPYGCTKKSPPIPFVSGRRNDRRLARFGYELTRSEKGCIVKKALIRSNAQTAVLLSPYRNPSGFSFFVYSFSLTRQRERMDPPEAPKCESKSCGR